MAKKLEIEEKNRILGRNPTSKNTEINVVKIWAKIGKKFVLDTMGDHVQILQVLGM